MSQSFRSIKFIFEKGGDISDFLILSFFSFPAWLTISLSFGVFFGILMSYSKLDDEKEKRSIELNHKKALLKEKKEEGKTLNKDKKKRKKILADLEKEKSQLKKSHTRKTQMVKEMEKLIKKLYADFVQSKKYAEESKNYFLDASDMEIEETGSRAAALEMRNLIKSLNTFSSSLKTIASERGINLD